MSYIELINAAWELREQGVISIHEHDLYTYLIHKCNKLGWKNPFNQPTEIICAVLRINRNALVNRRNKLHSLGLISFKEGKAKSKPAEYTLHIRKDTVPDTLTNTITNTLTYTLSDTFGYTLPYTNTKDKTREDKTREKEKTKKEIFRKPSLQEVVEYCRHRENDLDPQTFVDFYEAKNWMIGKNKMKDWQACVRTWEGKQNENRHNAAKHSKNKDYEMF
ncbi:hypothetical protein JGH11_16810 [Dysgonomonas sp. Marseille-P4677]|uniref:hypothetical protein n=1 Tax=Dysgonomonas sp. Marseille-P4677 TaxID=2364790 RepID=UPI001913DB5F|nr:hypothetical protein [Dysgonomonas sp. Marseille-P4677]MBK5722537.1 hypothetical protein [Dysgonomonas sp. Marseille-P4677]